MPQALFFPQKVTFEFLENPLIFYKLLAVLGIAAGAFFSSKKSLFDFRDGSGVHLCHKISILGGLLGNLGYLGNWLISLLSVPGQ